MTKGHTRGRGRGVVSPPDCPDANRLAAFIEGRLTGADQEQVQRHLLSCGDCYSVFGETVQWLDQPGASRSRSVPVRRVLLAAAAVLVLIAALGGWFGIS